jgi:transposase
MPFPFPKGRLGRVQRTVCRGLVAANARPLTLLQSARPSMRFVATKSEQQQSGLMLHRSRQLLVYQRTML